MKTAYAVITYNDGAEYPYEIRIDVHGFGLASSADGYDDHAKTRGEAEAKARAMLEDYCDFVSFEDDIVVNGGIRG